MYRSSWLSVGIVICVCICAAYWPSDANNLLVHCKTASNLYQLTTQFRLHGQNVYWTALHSSPACTALQRNTTGLMALMKYCCISHKQNIATARTALTIPISNSKTSRPNNQSSIIRRRQCLRYIAIACSFGDVQHLAFQLINNITSNPFINVQFNEYTVHHLFHLLVA